MLEHCIFYQWINYKLWDCIMYVIQLQRRVFASSLSLTWFLLSKICHSLFLLFIPIPLTKEVKLEVFACRYWWCKLHGAGVVLHCTLYYILEEEDGQVMVMRMTTERKVIDVSAKIVPLLFAVLLLPFVCLWRFHNFTTAYWYANEKRWGNLNLGCPFGQLQSYDSLLWSIFWRLSHW